MKFLFNSLAVKNLSKINRITRNHLLTSYFFSNQIKKYVFSTREAKIEVRVDVMNGAMDGVAHHRGRTHHALRER